MRRAEKSAPKLEAEKTKVDAIQCVHCKDTIYSRAHYDFHWCSCKTIAIDGGFEYTRILFNKTTDFTRVELSVDATKRQLYDDWNLKKNKYGLIKCATLKGKTRHKKGK